MKPLLTVRLTTDRDVVLARHRARRVASLMGFNQSEQSRIATAVSEVARHAVNGSGKGRCRIEVGPRGIRFVIVDAGSISAVLRAIAEEQITGKEPEAKSGRDRSRVADQGMGVRGAQRLMDSLKVSSERAGTVIRMERRLPSQAPDAPKPAQLAAALAEDTPADPVLELHAQNQGLVDALAKLAAQQEALERANAELDKARKLAERAAMLRERTLAVVSHDLRSPLGAVDAALAIIERLSEDNPAVVKRAAAGRRAAARMSRLIEDLLDVASIEAGGLSTEPNRCQLESVLAEVVSGKRHEAKQAQLTLSTEIAPLPEVFADAERIAQLLDNLVSNAIKFTPAGGRVTVAAEPVGSGIVIEVRDEGPGIAPEDIERIFSAFYQTQGDRRGAGLGLAICRGIVNAHNGRLTVSSTVGEGTTFRAELPVDGPPLKK